MKSYHLLIVAGDIITTDSEFYKVAIGTSQQDVRCCKFLRDYSAAHGYFFQIWSIETNLFLEKIAASLSQQLHDLPFLKINVSDLVSFIKNHRGTPCVPPMSRAAARARQLIDPAVYFQRQIAVLRKAEARRRKKPKAECVTATGFISSLKDRPSADGRLL